nr:hypothetical protein [Tanacetum cinerariifolium]
AELNYEGFKRQKTNKASGLKQPNEEENELSQEDLQQMMMVVPVEEVYLEALQKAFNRDDLVMLWSLVKERFSLTEPTDDKERTLWIKLKRLFEPNTDDTLWKLQRYMHDPLTWRLYDTCRVHHVSTEKEMDIFMLVEKEYPLSKGILTLMLVNKLNQSRSYEVYDYKYLEDIEVQRGDCQLYNFKEGDFLRHHMHDIKDMLLLLIQKKLSNLERDDSKASKKKLNITKPETFRSDISNIIPYTTYNNPQGIIYEDKYKINRLMRTDELYKFSDGTLTSVRSVLHNIASNLRMDYLPKRRWSSLDRKRSRIMIKAIDQQLLERRLMRILEKFVGERDYGEDL